MYSHKKKMTEKVLGDEGVFGQESRFQRSLFMIFFIFFIVRDFGFKGHMVVLYLN